jgi:hypothetical protein
MVLLEVSVVMEETEVSVDPLETEALVRLELSAERVEMAEL